MLIEIKVKKTTIIDGKTRKKTETFVIDKEFFSEAEYAVTAEMTSDVTVEEFSIQSLRISPIKEIATQFEGNSTFIATLKDIFHEDDGTEKSIRYKVLLWADNLQEATSDIHQLARQGYDMLIEGVKEVDYIYLGGQDNGAGEAVEE